jgi:hypothetical protein
MNIEKEHFEAWLYSQPKDMLVDLADGNNCLLCRFVRDTTGLPIRALWDVFVTPTGMVRPYSFYNRIPEWFRAMINPAMSMLGSVQSMGELQDVFRKVFPKETESTDEPKQPCSRKPYQMVWMGELEKMMMAMEPVEQVPA